MLEAELAPVGPAGVLQVAAGQGMAAAMAVVAGLTLARGSMYKSLLPPKAQGEVAMARKLLMMDAPPL